MLCYNYKADKNLGVAQLVARYLGVVEAARSSRVTQTKYRIFMRDMRKYTVFLLFYVHKYENHYVCFFGIMRYLIKI